ncbi:MAG TPA: type II toxin-antitoxin system VapC family toxin [Candidatus Sulfotelmatobacter sp.]|jgi:PIN domain nuclease of toxin-antitoxin system
MRFLLDTQTLIWWMTDDPQLSKNARTAIAREANASLVSAASAWGIAIKVRLGRLPASVDLVQDFVADLALQRIEILEISAEHGVRAGLLPGPHKDPFDRMLIAQAQAEGIAIVSNDRALDDYGLRRIS